MCSTVLVWRSEHDFMESVFFYFYMGQIQTVGLVHLVASALPTEPSELLLVVLKASANKNKKFT